MSAMKTSDLSSTNLNLPIPKGLHRKISHVAGIKGCFTNTLIIEMLERSLGLMLGADKGLADIVNAIETYREKS